MERFQGAARKAAGKAKTVMSVVPRFTWWRYAALRLGTFLMTYFMALATIVIGFALFGIALSLGAILAMIPIAVFIAIRISGAMTEKYNEKSNSARTPSP